MCFETIFYNFWKFFTNFIEFFKISVFLRNTDFEKFLKNSKKFPKKCKIWSPSIFQYEEHVEKFGLTI